ncbi:hypothetical protein ACNSZF_08220 [Burkholderia gladioli]
MAVIEAPSNSTPPETVPAVMVPVLTSAICAWPPLVTEPLALQALPFHGDGRKPEGVPRSPQACQPQPFTYKRTPIAMPTPGTLVFQTVYAAPFGPVTLKPALVMDSGSKAMPDAGRTVLPTGTTVQL